ncbi:MAG: Fic family protein [Deltaproteobacteria bacterium]|nr:Fic family protein [Deltaproteobacteria bacterium]
MDDEATKREGPEGDASSSTPTRIRWQSIKALDPGSIPQNGAFAGLEALRDAWASYLKDLSEDDRVRIRQRSLRRLAIETGIIERLYEVDWGLTLTLVAEGFSRDVIERAGGRIDDQTLATLISQRDSLEMVLDFVRTDRTLSDSFIKELHAALTRSQKTYLATDTIGRSVERPLEHGAWKIQPNHVQRKDGTLLEYAPPEHVQSEIDRLLCLHRELEARSETHPLVKAAWLHHRFVQIHPFVDGNGRVARALTLLVLEQHRYAPLVVDRFHRGDYLDALDRANDGELWPLVKLFIRLESAALTGELERPEIPAFTGLSRDIAHTLAHQVAALRAKKATDVENKLQLRAVAVRARIKQWFEAKTEELRTTFKSEGVTDADVQRFGSGDDQSKLTWFRKQVIDSARATGHYATFTPLGGWWHLRIRLKKEGMQLRYVASLHGAGREAGVMAVTTFAEIAALSGDAGPEGSGPPEYVQTTSDAFQFVYSEHPDRLDERSSELSELLDSGLTVALARTLRQL